jgi:hypothetical protein
MSSKQRIADIARSVVTAAGLLGEEG